MNEYIQSTLTAPDMLNDCGKHHVYLKRFGGHYFVVLVDSQEEAILCAGWMHQVH